MHHHLSWPPPGPLRNQNLTNIHILLRNSKYKSNLCQQLLKYFFKTPFTTINILVPLDAMTQPQCQQTDNTYAKYLLKINVCMVKKCAVAFHLMMKGSTDSGRFLKYFLKHIIQNSKQHRWSCFDSIQDQRGHFTDFTNITFRWWCTIFSSI